MNPQSVFVDKLLTNVYIGYKNAELIADELFPRVEVNEETGIYFKNDKSNLVAPSDTRRALSGTANRITGKLLQDTYALEEHVLEEYIDDRVKKQAQSPFNPERNATNRIAGVLAIEKEEQLRDNLATATASVNNVDIAGAWDTVSTDIRAAVLTGKDNMQKKTGVRPNTMVVDRVTYNGLIKNTDIKNSIAYTSDKTESKIRSLLAAYFDVDRVLIAGGIQQSAAVSGTGSFIWSTKGIAYLAYVNPSPSIEEVVNAGYQLFMEDMVYVDKRREEAEKSDVVRATDFYVQKITDADALYRMYDTITT